MSTTYRTRINNETIRIVLLGRPGSCVFGYVDASEQCDDCGFDRFRLQRDRAGAVDCLVCERCETAYPLRKEG